MRFLLNMGDRGIDQFKISLREICYRNVDWTEIAHNKSDNGFRTWEVTEAKPNFTHQTGLLLRVG